ncbi:MAG: hypothetical protein DBX61_00380, partial [Clostridiales bacterium]
MRDYLWGSAPNLKRGIVYGALPQTPPARFSFGEKRGKRTYISFFTLSFRAGVYGTKTGMVSRKIKFVILACLFASIAGGLTALFSLVRKKVPKKYAEG